MPDAELLPLFAKMLPQVVIFSTFQAYGGSFETVELRWRSAMGGFRGDRVRDTEYLSLCHKIEEGMTEGEHEEFSDLLFSFLGNYGSRISAPWQARIQAAAKVKGCCD